jgi:hypothetical protein
MLIYRRYLKHIDRYQSSHISCFITGGSIKFLLLSNPETHTAQNISTVASRSSAAQGRQSSASTYNPTAQAVEEATKNFFMECYDVWVKTLMNPFYDADMVVRSAKFRERVTAAGRRYL